jgi:hypothetical protein
VRGASSVRIFLLVGSLVTLFGIAVVGGFTTASRFTTTTTITPGTYYIKAVEESTTLFKYRLNPDGTYVGDIHVPNGDGTTFTNNEGRWYGTWYWDNSTKQLVLRETGKDGNGKEANKSSSTVNSQTTTIKYRLQQIVTRD